MPRVVGIDPGTKSYDLFGLEDETVFLDRSIPTEKIARKPNLLYQALSAVGSIDAIVAPLGYGLPLRRIDALRSKELAVMNLLRKDDTAVSVPESLVNYDAVISCLQKASSRVYAIPGVILLPTVPAFRKVNKIDMGTPDKVCSAVLALHDFLRKRVPIEEATFILVEAGYAYNAVIGVQNGKIIDGIGGTTGSLGFNSLGAMDGELAYLLEPFSKDVLFQGGVTSIVGKKNLSPKEFVEFVEKKNVKYCLAWSAFIEGLAKSIMTIKVSVGKPTEILVSGRLARFEKFFQLMKPNLTRYGYVRKVVGLGKNTKEAAQGAAIIADGLMNGKSRQLVEHLGLKKARGTVLDYLFLKQARALRREYWGTS